IDGTVNRGSGVALNPAQLGRRYSPLILLAAAQLVLAAVAPSIPGGSSGTNVAARGGAAGQSGDVGQGADTGPGASGAAGSPAAASASGGSSTGGGAGGGSAAAAAAGARAPGGDRRQCGAHGKQHGITLYLAPSSPR